MSEMVETIARAIWALNLDTDCTDYDQLTPHAKERANSWARAALQALRKPTAAMLETQATAYPGAPPGALEQLWWLAVDEALR